jgi:hypothetical protein
VFAAKPNLLQAQQVSGSHRRGVRKMALPRQIFRIPVQILSKNCPLTSLGSPANLSGMFFREWLMSDWRSKGGLVRAVSSAMPVAAVIIATMFSAERASAATVHYTSISVIGESIHITHPDDVRGEAGQITLKGVTGLGSTTSLVAWCLDVFDFLKNSSTFTGGGPLANTSNLIGGLMQEGNNYIANGSTLNVGGHTFNTHDISAATQVAIWSVEYGAAFSYSSIGASNSHFGDLVSYLEQHATPNVAYWTLNERGNQTLGTLDPVPGPIVGAGLPGLILASTGLLGWWRRKRSVRAAA